MRNHLMKKGRVLKSLMGAVAAVAFAMCMLPAAASAAWLHDSVPESQVTNVATLTEGVNAAVNFDGNKQTKKWFSFTASQSDLYCFYSTSNLDTYVVLYQKVNGTYESIDSSRNGASDNNFRLDAYLQKGMTYYICASCNYSDSKGTGYVAVNHGKALFDLQYQKVDPLYTGKPVSFGDLNLQLGTYVEGEWSDEEGDYERVFQPISASNYRFTGWYDDDGNLIGTDPEKGPNKPGDFFSAEVSAVSGSGYFGSIRIEFYTESNRFFDDESRIGAHASNPMCTGTSGYIEQIYVDLVDSTSVMFDDLGIQLGRYDRDSATWSYDADLKYELTGFFSSFTPFRGGIGTPCDVTKPLEAGVYRAVYSVSYHGQTGNFAVQISVRDAKSINEFRAEGRSIYCLGDTLRAEDVADKLIRRNAEGDEELGTDSFAYDGWTDADGKKVASGDAFKPTVPGAYYLVLKGAGEYHGTVYCHVGVQDLSDLDVYYITADNQKTYYKNDAVKFSDFAVEVERYDGVTNEYVPAPEVTYAFKGWYAGYYDEDNGTEVYKLLGTDPNNGPVSCKIKDSYLFFAIQGTGAYKGVSYVSYARYVDKSAGYYASIRGIDASYAYTGRAITPVPIVLYRSNRFDELLAGVDYTVSYANNVNPGTATIKVTGKNGYDFVETATFTIRGTAPTQPSKPAPVAKPAGTKLSAVSGTYKVTKSGAAPEVAYAKAPAKKSVTIPATVTVGGVTYKVTSVAASAFKANKKITTFTIGANVTKIGASAFYNCKKLKTITIKSKKLKSVGKKAFKGIYATAKVKVPKAKLKAYKKLLKKGNLPTKAKVVKL